MTRKRALSDLVSAVLQYFASGRDYTRISFVSFAAVHGLFGYVEDHISEFTTDGCDGGEFGGPLQAAVVSGDLAMVRMILDHGVNVNTQGGRFGTAMAAAITLQYRDMIELLKQYGADIELQSPGSPLIRSMRPENADLRWAAHRNPFSRARAYRPKLGDVDGGIGDTAKEHLVAVR